MGITSKADLTIDMALQEWWCTMISPQSNYIRDEFWIGWKSIDRTQENYNKLQQTISTRMQALYTKQLAATLKNTTPILCIDCKAKGESDIIFFILQQYTQGKDSINHLILESLHRRSIVNEQGYRRQYEIDKTSNTQEILSHYSKLLKQYTNTHDSAELMYGFEFDRIINTISNILKHEDEKYLYLYLDNIENLTINEQSRLNNILYTRGRMYEDRRMRLKINNGWKDWKAWTTNTRQKVQSIHDYGETSIKEEYIISK